MSQNAFLYIAIVVRPPSLKSFANQKFCYIVLVLGGKTLCRSLLIISAQSLYDLMSFFWSAKLFNHGGLTTIAIWEWQFNTPLCIKKPETAFVPNWIEFDGYAASCLPVIKEKEKWMESTIGKKLLHPYIRCIKKYLEKVVYFSSGGFPWFSPYTLTQNSFYRRTLTLMSFIFMK